MVEIAPSMLGADFGRMREAAELVGPHSAYLHMDVMDGHFVPNLTMGPDLVKSLNGIAPLDVHLMVTDPINFIDDFRDAGAKIISVHVEANEPLEALELIKKNNMKAGIALNPSTPKNSIEPFIVNKSKGAFILCLTSNPGALEIQNNSDSGTPVYQRIVKIASELNINNNTDKKIQIK